MLKFIKNAIFLLLLTFFMVTTNVFAAGTGQITINNATVGETYTIYKMFDLESYDKTVTPNVYAYKMTSAWAPFFAVGAAGHDYVEVDENGYVTATSLLETNTETFAKLALAYAKANTGTISEVTHTEASSSSVVFSNLDLGYYLVDTTLGTLCSLDTTDDTITIQDKNIIPTISASVKEGSNFGPTNDADIGDTINYKLEIDAYKGAEDYIVHTTLSSGIAFDSTTANIVVKDVTDSSNPVTLTLGEDYTIVTSDIGSETFRIVFDQDYLDTIAGTSSNATKIEVTFDAKLDTDATIAGAGNIAAFSLSYDDGSNKTAADSTKTYTWPVSFYKFHKDLSQTKQPLGEAVFSLSTTNTVGGAISLVNVSGTIYRVALPTDENKVTTITTTATGEFTIQGLDAGTYYLIETEAPDGYNKLSKPVELKIVSSTETDETMSAVVKVLTGTSWEVAADVQTVTRVEVENKSGTRLPSTGGRGTKAFICVGLILFLSTALVLITKKRLYNEG